MLLRARVFCAHVFARAVSRARVLCARFARVLCDVDESTGTYRDSSQLGRVDVAGAVAFGQQTQLIVALVGPQPAL